MPQMTSPTQISLLRLYLLRGLYLLNFALLGLDVWPVLIAEGGTMEPLKGVAYSFWCALSALSLLGLRYPLRMLPVLLMQFAYKLIWLSAIALPQWDSVRASGLTNAMLFGLLVDLLVIPWPWVFRNYVQQRGDRWRNTAPTPHNSHR